MIKKEIDVAVIGGGPAGISACLELSQEKRLKTALFESKPELGGIPRTCNNIFFGMRDMNRMFRGKSYADKLEKLVRKTAVQIHTKATVMSIIPGRAGERHGVKVLSPSGFVTYESRFVLLATGCYEQSRDSRLIPGSRPAGIVTTGTLLESIHSKHKRAGNRAVIIGSELIAFSILMTLRRAGVSVVGMVEEDKEIHANHLLASIAKTLFHFPILRDTSVMAIEGAERVERLRLRKKENRAFQLDCDTVILTGKLRPDSSLIYETDIERDPLTLGPVVDMNMMTSVPNIYAAGNVLRGGEMHDLCALEGKRAGRNILRSFAGIPYEQNSHPYIMTERPFRYVVPQKIVLALLSGYRSSRLRPCISFQMERTIKNPVIEAWSGHEIIWMKRYRKLTAATRIPLPIEKFDWNRVSEKQGVRLMLAEKPSRHRVQAPNSC